MIADTHFDIILIVKLLKETNIFKIKPGRNSPEDNKFVDLFSIAPQLSILECQFKIIRCGQEEIKIKVKMGLIYLKETKVMPISKKTMVSY